MRWKYPDYEIECPECDELQIFETDSNEILISTDETCQDCGAEISSYVSEQFYGGP